MKKENFDCCWTLSLLRNEESFRESRFDIAVTGEFIESLMEIASYVGTNQISLYLMRKLVYAYDALENIHSQAMGLYESVDKQSDVE